MHFSLSFASLKIAVTSRKLSSYTYIMYSNLYLVYHTLERAGDLVDAALWSLLMTNANKSVILEFKLLLENFH